MNEEEKNVNTNQMDNNMDDFGLKWGDESIKSDIASYTYQDPTVQNTTVVNTENTPSTESPTTINTENTPVTEPVIAQNPSNNENQVTVENETPVSETANSNAPLENTPVVPNDSNIQTETPTPPVSTSPTVEEEQPKGKKSTILLVLLFIFMLLFVLFLPEITNYINLALTNKEVQGDMSQTLETPTPIPTQPIPSATPSPSPTVEEGISLEEIVTEFEKSEMVSEIKEQDNGVVLRSSWKEDTLTIDYQSSIDMINRSSTYQKKGSILSSNNADITTATILVEVISRLQKNEEGLSKVIFEGDLTEYSLSQNGISIEVNPNQTLTMQIDLSKPLKLVEKEEIEQEETNQSENE